VNIGRNPVYTGDYFVGTIDEVRIANTALSSSWINTEYNNQSSPSTFYSIGTESTPGATSFSESNLNAYQASSTIEASAELRSE
jgi:hypothetical protein